MAERPLIRGYSYRLYPTPEQEERLSAYVGAVRFVYNLCREQREIWGRRHRLTWVTQSAELIALRAASDWLEAVPRTALEQAIRDLDKAYVNFFRRGGGYPRPRKYGRDDSCRFKSNEVRVKRLNGKWSAMRVPKLGWVKFRDTRPLGGAVKNVTVLRRADQWFVSFQCETEPQTAIVAAGEVGIDRGVANTLALSTGELLSLPATLSVLAVSIARAQRVASRRVRGSARHRKATAAVRATQARGVRIRADWHHRATRRLVRQFGLIAVEDLRILNMTASASGTVEEPGRNVAQKRGLNRAILNQGWQQFERLLTYKMEETGGLLIKVPPHYTSQTCPGCGTVSAESRKSQAVFVCVVCGLSGHADVFAAKEILRRSTSFVEGVGYDPVEAKTLTGFRVGDADSPRSDLGFAHAVPEPPYAGDADLAEPTPSEQEKQT